MRKSVKITIITLSTLLIIVGVVFGIFYYLRVSGKSQLEAITDSSNVTMETKEEEKREEPLKENQVRYQDEVYELKNEVYNILVMGVDTQGEVTKDGKTNKAGQADTLFLVSLDNEDKKITMINLNRDTMANISIYDYFGNFSHKQEEQLALAYAYGTDSEKGAQLTCEAVSELLYGMPIHGYCSLNMSAIPIINDSVGGVELTLLDDFTATNPNLVKDSRQVLKGEDALTYIRGRQGVGDETNVSRMARQKQYMQGFMKVALEEVKKDLTLPIKLYQTITPYMLTNVTVNQVTYLVSSALDYSFGESQMKNIEGTIDTTDLYNKFYPDKEKLYELVLEVFYKKVETKAESNETTSQNSDTNSSQEELTEK